MSRFTFPRRAVRAGSDHSVAGGGALSLPQKGQRCRASRAMGKYLPQCWHFSARMAGVPHLGHLIGSPACALLYRPRCCIERLKLVLHEGFWHSQSVPPGKLALFAGLYSHHPSTATSTTDPTTIP